MEDKILKAYSDGITLEDICLLYKVTEREIITIVYGSKTKSK